MRLGETCRQLAAFVMILPFFQPSCAWVKRMARSTIEGILTEFPNLENSSKSHQTLAAYFQPSCAWVKPLRRGAKIGAAGSLGTVRGSKKPSTWVPGGRLFCWLGSGMAVSQVSQGGHFLHVLGRKNAYLVRDVTHSGVSIYARAKMNTDCPYWAV